jgi:uncharacterized membrane protein YkoI
MRAMLFLPAACLVAACFTTVLRADEEKVPLDKLPDPIKASLKEKFPDAKLIGAEKEKMDKETVYEVELEYKGAKYDVTFKADGSIVSSEKTIAVKDLPKAVVAALEGKYPKATINSAEEVTKGKDLKELSYEVVITTADKKKFEIELDPMGKILETEEKKEEKKD